MRDSVDIGLLRRVDRENGSRTSISKECDYHT